MAKKTERVASSARSTANTTRGTPNSPARKASRRVSPTKPVCTSATTIAASAEAAARAITRAVDSPTSVTNRSRPRSRASNACVPRASRPQTTMRRALSMRALVGSRATSFTICINASSQQVPRHRREQPLRSEPQQDGEQQNQRELERQDDEAEIAPVARREPQQHRHADRGQRKEQKQPDKDYVVPLRPGRSIKPLRWPPSPGTPKAPRRPLETRRAPTPRDAQAVRARARC